MPHSAGSSSGGGYNPPPPQQSSSSPRARNIIIGSIATIVTSTIIFLITQYLKKPEGDRFLSTKEATTSAWNSYVGYENIYSDNSLSISKNPNQVSPDSILNDFKKESEKFQRDVKDLAASKRIDKDLKKMLERRIENEINSMPALEKYYADIDKINKNNSSQKEKRDALVSAMSRYNEYVKGAYERALNDMQGIADVLSKRYDLKFSMTDFRIVELQPRLIRSNDSVVNMLRNISFDSSGQMISEQPGVPVKAKDIIGNWNSDGAVFSFEKNGKMAWSLPGGQKATGTWTIVDNKLRLDGEINTQKQKGFWLFFVNNITESSLSLISVKDPTLYYDLVRIITQ